MKVKVHVKFSVHNRDVALNAESYSIYYRTVEKDEEIV